jgi:hypothetical protein
VQLDCLVDRGYLPAEDRQNSKAMLEALSCFLNDELDIEKWRGVRDAGARQIREKTSPLTDLPNTAGPSDTSIKNIKEHVTDARASASSALVKAIQGPSAKFINGYYPGAHPDAWRWSIHVYRTKANSWPVLVKKFRDFDSMLMGLREIAKDFPSPDYRLSLGLPALLSDQRRKALEREGFRIGS